MGSDTEKKGAGVEVEKREGGKNEARGEGEMKRDGVGVTEELGIE